MARANEPNWELGAQAHQVRTDSRGTAPSKVPRVVVLWPLQHRVARPLFDDPAGLHWSVCAARWASGSRATQCGFALVPAAQPYADSRTVARGRNRVIGESGRAMKP